MVHRHRQLAGALGLFALVLLVGCTATTPQRTTSPVSSGRPPATEEAERVRAVRPLIDRMTQAFESRNLAASRDAYEAYDAAWNGIEVYINFRSRALYAAIEQDLQAKIGQGLDTPQPNFAELTTLSRSLAGKYDEAIALVQKDPPLSLLFDDLATLRITRADLRIATAALDAGDLPKARQHVATFKQNYPTTQSLLKVRSTSDEQETTAALNALNARLQQPEATVADVNPLVAALIDRYNFGINLTNAAARNADGNKPGVTDADKKLLTDLHLVQVQLDRSQAAWEAGRYPEAATTAATAAGPSFTAVQPALAAKSSDAPLKTALIAYAQLAGGPGDADKVRAAQKAALEQIAIAQQVLVGQFWTDPQLQAFLADLPNT
jgi:hypothetical protein